MSSWMAAVRRAETFVTYGPLLEFTVGGLTMGQRTKLSASGGTLDVTWKVASAIVPMTRVELVVNGTRVVEAGGQRIALFNTAGTYRAISNTCLHQGGFLGEGSLEGEVVTCSRHGYQFDVTSGDCLSHPGRGVEAYEVRVVEGEIQVYV